MSMFQLSVAQSPISFGDNWNLRCVALHEQPKAICWSWITWDIWQTLVLLIQKPMKKGPSSIIWRSTKLRVKSLWVLTLCSCLNLMQRSKYSVFLLLPWRWTIQFLSIVSSQVVRHSWVGLVTATPVLYGTWWATNTHTTRGSRALDTKPGCSLNWPPRGNKLLPVKWNYFQKI